MSMEVKSMNRSMLGPGLMERKKAFRARLEEFEGVRRGVHEFDVRVEVEGAVRALVRKGWFSNDSELESPSATTT